MPRRMFNREPMRPEYKATLEAALKRAALHVMTPEQHQTQRRSFEIGQLMLDHPDYSREHAERIVDAVLAPVSCPCCERGK